MLDEKKIHANEVVCTANDLTVAAQISKYKIDSKLKNVVTDTSSSPCFDALTLINIARKPRYQQEQN